MAKLASMFFVLIAIQAVLLIYQGGSLAGGGTGGDIWTFIMNMDRWGSLTFSLALIGIAAGIFLAGIAAASIFGFKTDFLIFAPAMMGFISLGVVMTNLAMFLKNQLSTLIFNCEGLGLSAVNYASCISSQSTVTTFIVGLTVGPLAFYYVWTVIEWWRGKDF